MKKNSFLLVLAALIWGVAFVAQSEGGDIIGPYAFNGIRSFIGALVLLPVIAILNRGKKERNEDKKTLIVGGICCGIILGIASNIQQFALYLGASAGKAGFLTACYILMVPIAGIFLKRKCGKNVWIAVVIAIVGLYLLCIKSGSSGIEVADLLLLLCALAFTFHIMVIDHFSPMVDGVKMSAIQFLVAGIISFILMFIFENDFKLIIDGFSSGQVLIPVLYTGVLSSGVAYTLQIVGQKNVNPTVASLLMSLESVFAALAGWLILKESMDLRQLLGCGLIFVGIVLAQLPAKNK